MEKALQCITSLNSSLTPVGPNISVGVCPQLTSCGIPAVASTSPFQCVYRYQPFGFSPHLGLQMSPPAALLQANVGYQRSANRHSTQAPQCQVDQKVGLSTLDL